VPLVRISMLANKSETDKKNIADAVHQALVDTISIPAQDRFQLITEHRETDLIYDPIYLNLSRTDEIVIIEVTLSAGRSVEIKRALYKRMVELLGQVAEIRKEDVLINLLEVAKENWSFGNGVAQYAI
jgi:4-oxalocrotonate tautomerase